MSLGGAPRGWTRTLAVAALTAAAIAPPAAATAQATQTTPTPPTPEPGFITPLSPGVQHLHFRYGPLTVQPGSNLILLGPVTIEKPAYDGYVLGFRPNLTYADGSVPGIDVVHLHHAVWLNTSGSDTTGGGSERFAASGEEKTALVMPPGYGYPVKGSDFWVLNYMLHNLTPQPQVVYITYDVDYLPASDPAASKITPVKPIWMDVQNGSAYPVFDVHQNSGSTTGCGYQANGTPTSTPSCYTYPADAQNPYGGGAAKNEWTAQKAGTLVFGVGHLHPGGLSDTLTLTRGGNSVGLFTSQADYYDPGGPISWDMAMTVTPPSWQVGIQPGDKLSVQATYDTSRASWYEDMGIMILWEAVGQPGPDPFTNPPPTTGQPTHGHLQEASNHGGPDLPSPDPASLPDGQTLDNQIGIAGFQYVPGNIGSPSSFQNPPAVHPGQTLQFNNLDWGEQIFHTITACKDPCNGPTGISYPIANGPVEFDSRELGYGPTGFTAASNSSNWTIPATLPPGTYTYFCRIHPFMRGAFRVLPH